MGCEVIKNNRNYRKNELRAVAVGQTRECATGTGRLGTVCRLSIITSPNCLVFHTSMEYRVKTSAWCEPSWREDAVFLKSMI